MKTEEILRRQREEMSEEEVIADWFVTIETPYSSHIVKLAWFPNNLRIDFSDGSSYMYRNFTAEDLCDAIMMVNNGNPPYDTWNNVLEKFIKPKFPAFKIPKRRLP